MTFSRGTAILTLIAAVSVAVNLFLAGDLLGHQFAGPPGSFEQRLDMIWQSLPDTDKPIAKEVLARHRDNLVLTWRASRAPAQRAGVALRADPFEESEARADFEKANQRVQDFRKELQDTFIELASKISPAGREKLRSPVGGL